MRKVFLSHAAEDAATAERLETELLGRGFGVHRSDQETITPAAHRALGEASVLVAVCSPRYSRVRARQWELTRAVLSARRGGAVRDRVIAFGPSAGDGHVVPGELLDVRTRDVAGAVAEKPESPFGDPGAFDERLSVPRFPVDFRRLWTLHTALRGSAYAITGPAGAGKTRLAEEYRLFFGDEYPGGVVWTGLGDEHREPYLAAAFADTADAFGLDLHGLGLDATVRALGNAIPEDALWIIDGAVADLLPHGIRALVTTRGRTILPHTTLPAPQQPWPVPVSPAARTVLAFAALLGPAPITADVLVPGVGDLLGPRAPMLVADAVEELAALALLRPADIGDRPAWLVPAPVAAAVRDDLAPGTREQLTWQATRVLSRLLTGGAAGPVRRHALELGGDLLPLLAAHHEERGDVAAACETWRAAGDALASARGAAPAEVIRRTAPVIQRARLHRDIRTEFRARLLAAVAHDERGEPRRADKVFHDHPLVAAQGAEPVWLKETERRDVRLARVRALRLRGRYREARELLDALLPGIRRAYPEGAVRGAWPMATLEDARLHLHAENTDRARAAAGRLVSLLHSAGRSADRCAGEAVVVLTEGEHSAEPARRALRASAKTFGVTDPLTLELRIVLGRALCRDGDIPEAVEELGKAVTETNRALGATHPLTLRARQAAALAVRDCGGFARAAVMLESLLPVQEEVLGHEHPDCGRTRLELGLCLARAHRCHRARPFLKAGVKALQDQAAPWPRWVGAARAALALADLPGPLGRLCSRERAQPGCHPMP